ncbi:hypothetical protein [Nocardia macrotermitis]|uniref:DUF8017 domain-containing protein n=1 Tax=Nocardia macrotermitis TaxID=2585198 RepID=A0A7K0CWX4_9NOCA|nr:hypothetical protein [Nocardia macrotermitis]MQY17928.1 hypothetical protein [Nocardia macrotermitis]
MSSTSGDSGEQSSSKDHPRSQQASVLRGLDLPHPTSPADTTHTEMIDMRGADDARTQAIPQAGPRIDNSRTEVIRQAEPRGPQPDAPRAQPDPPRAQPPRGAANSPGQGQVPNDSAQTEAFHQLSFGQQGASAGQQPLALSPEIAQYAPDGRPDARTSPIPQQAVSPPRRARSGSPKDAPPPQPVGRGRPHGGPTSPIARQPLAEQGVPQPEQAWQLGTPEQAGSRSETSANTSARQSDSARHPETAPRPDAEDDKHADRPLSARERKRWLFAGIGAAAVVILGIGATLLLTGRHSDDATGTVSALSSGASAAPLATPAQTTAPATIAGVAPLIPGYQVVQVPERGAAFDVPKSWQLDANGTKTWGTAPETVEIAGLVQDGKGYCPNYIRTNAFLTMSGKPDPAAAAVDIGTRLAKIGWATSTGTTPGKAEPLTSLDGQLHGSFAETDGTFKPPAPGCAKTYSVYTFAFPSENGSFVVTVTADTGVPHAIDRATAQKILASIRPLQAK